MRHGASRAWAAGGKPVAVFVAAIVIAGAAAAQDFQPGFPDIAQLPEGAGREQVFYTCTACHGLDIIKAQRLSREGWEGTVSYMTDVHGMLEPTPEDRAAIIDYLSTTFGRAAPDAPAYSNPFL